MTAKLHHRHNLLFYLTKTYEHPLCYNTFIKMDLNFTLNNTKCGGLMLS